MSKTVRIIAGPTASGKSARALELAERENGVIINADSMQVYAALPILTAQPSDEDKARAPHVLYGFLDPNEDCSAGRWNGLARAEIERAFENGQSPIVVGGTGLYIKTLAEGLSDMPEVPTDVRARVVALYEELGPQEFYQELKKRDPVMAARFHPNHKARLIRAYEMLAATGHSLSEFQAQEKDAPPEDWSFEIELVMPERDVLIERCNARFDKMLESGAAKETEDLADKIEAGDVRPNALITKALGFKPLAAYLRGDISKEEAVEKSRTQTRQYAKRQITWFKNQL